MVEPDVRGKGLELSELYAAGRSCMISHRMMDAAPRSR